VGLKGSPADFDVHFFYYLFLFFIFLIFLRFFKILYLYHILKLFIKQMSLQTSNKQANRISRRLTVNTNEPFISIRPIIKSKSLNKVLYIYMSCLTVIWF
jgi:nucleoside permease NupC